MTAAPTLHELVTALLEVRTWTAHDLADDGRVLAGHDEHGSSHGRLLHQPPQRGRHGRRRPRPRHRSRAGGLRRWRLGADGGRLPWARPGRHHRTLPAPQRDARHRRRARRRAAGHRSRRGLLPRARPLERRRQRAHPRERPRPGSPGDRPGAARRLALGRLVEDPEHDLTVDPSPAGDALLVGTLERGAITYAVHEADGALRARLAVPAYGMPVVRWSADGSRILVAGTSPTDPGSIWLAEAATGTAIRLVDGREALPPALAARLAEPSAHDAPAPDGERIPVKVHRPAPAVDPRIAGATVVHVHGGPESMAYAVFNPSLAALVAAGFTVAQPDVRGSTGYGKRWTALDDLDKRLDSVADLAAIHAWLPSIGVDPARVALWGGSYGGYLVLAGLTLQPGLWAAGVDIVGISSLVTFLENTSAYRRAYREREYGALATDRDMLERFSPITHLDGLRAPLFVIHRANDPRVPLSESEHGEGGAGGGAGSTADS